MINYTITVNGKSYNVSLEKRCDPAAPKVDTTAIVGTGNVISAPMPGRVIAVKVNVGDRAKKGQELIIIEAMKMHKPVLAAIDGVVNEIFVKQGNAIQTGTPLIFVG